MADRRALWRLRGEQPEEQASEDVREVAPGASSNPIPSQLDVPEGWTSGRLGRADGGQQAVQGCQLTGEGSLPSGSVSGTGP